MTFERLVCHQDFAFVICVTPQDVTLILFLAGHQLYSWPESVLNVEFPMKNARVKPEIWSRPISTPCRFFRVVIACNMLCSSVLPVKLTSLTAKLRSSGLCCRWISLTSPCKLSIRRAALCREDVVNDDCFYYHPWRNNVVIAFGTLSSFLT